MPLPNEIQVRLTPEKIAAHCQELDKQSASAGHTLAALTGLQTCLATMVPSGDHGLPVYREIMAVIEQHATATRARLLEESAIALVRALRERNQHEITHIHAALSRNGFMLVAKQAIAQLLSEELVVSTAWAKSWCEDAITRAQAASGYPDSLNFQGAGIQPEAYAAMTEMFAYLGGSVTYIA
ncbi:hypothetical protein [Sulfurirhabdus autotrophica]|uniref:Uncharacterized protein n=1 Tax=Sulfurirhabdus autotrophica TaxID=1706046 RepID=A0A4R3XW73_9PROT|nr:hypothetical protein [Sulfurirhabdus autotrophica]TCV83252.1 hypothetical protein EDC63_1162 [Sulfurirhabdus autotrophica]